METTFTEYIKSELLVLIPVLCFLGTILKSSKVINDKFIPLILGILGITLCIIWVVSTAEISGSRDIFLCIFTSVTQGLLVAAGAVYAHQMKKQIDK